MVSYIYTLLTLPNQKEDGAFPNIRKHYVIIASKKPIYEVHSLFNEDEVGKLNLKWDEPIPKEYCNNYYINPNSKEDLATLEEVKKVSKDWCHQVYVNEDVLYPYLVHERDFNNYNHLEIFNRKDFNQKRKLHIITYNNDIYFLYYITVYKGVDLLDENSKEYDPDLNFSYFVKTAQFLQVEKLIKSYYNGLIRNLDTVNYLISDYNLVI